MAYNIGVGIASMTEIMAVLEIELVRTIHNSHSLSIFTEQSTHTLFFHERSDISFNTWQDPGGGKVPWLSYMERGMWSWVFFSQTSSMSQVSVEINNQYLLSCQIWLEKARRSYQVPKLVCQHLNLSSEQYHCWVREQDFVRFWRTRATIH